jgi:TAP-like protein
MWWAAAISALEEPARTASATVRSRSVSRPSRWRAAARRASCQPVTERHDECAAWPEPPSRPEPWLTGNVDVPPVLIVSVSGDPVTPHQGGITALEGAVLTVGKDAV